MLEEFSPVAAEREEDVGLMHKATSGDTAPYQALFQRHSQRLRRMAYLLLRSAPAADEAVRETFRRGQDHIRSYRGEAEPRAWLASITLDACRQALRAPRKDDAKDVEEEKRPLTGAVGRLTGAQREVFVLHFVEGLPYQDLARMLNIRPGAARALAHRAKRLLQRESGMAFEDLLRTGLSSPGGNGP